MTPSTSRLPFWPRVFLGLFLSALSAILLTLAMPPYGLWPLAIVGPVPMLLAQYRIMPRRLSSLAFAIGIGGFVGLYLQDAFFQVAGSAWYMRALPLIFAVLFFFTELGDRALHDRTGYRWFVPAFALGWVGVEMIRSLIPLVGTWGFVGYSFFQAPALIQPVSVFGIFGLDLVVLLLGAALGLAVLALFDRRWRLDEHVATVGGPLARNWLLVAGALAIAWVGLSLSMLRQPQGQTVHVAAVQPNFHELLTPAEWATNSMTQARYNEAHAEYEARIYEMTRAAARRGAQLIVWPEGALSFDPQVQHTEELEALAAETKATLVIPYGVPVGLGLRNEVTVLTPQGEFLGVYGKDHPVTAFGETSLTRGNYPAYATAFGTVGTIICYDLDFTDTARKVAQAGAQLIAVPSGDWPAVAGKHYAHLVFRAVENRVAVVKADHSFDSAVIDPYGRIVANAVASQGWQGLVVAEVHPGGGGTLAQRLGDWVGWACLAGLAFFALPNPLLRGKAAAVQPQA